MSIVLPISIQLISTHRQNEKKLLSKFNCCRRQHVFNCTSKQNEIVWLQLVEFFSSRNLQSVFLISVWLIERQIMQVNIQMTILHVDSVKLDPNSSKPIFFSDFLLSSTEIHPYRNSIVYSDDLHFNCIHSSVTLYRHKFATVNEQTMQRKREKN